MKARRMVFELSRLATPPAERLEGSSEKQPDISRSTPLFGNNPSPFWPQGQRTYPGAHAWIRFAGSAGAAHLSEMSWSTRPGNPSAGG